MKIVECEQCEEIMRCSGCGGIMFIRERGDGKWRRRFLHPVRSFQRAMERRRLIQGAVAHAREGRDRF